MGSFVEKKGDPPPHLKPLFGLAAPPHPRYIKSVATPLHTAHPFTQRGHVNLLRLQCLPLLILTIILGWAAPLWSHPHLFITSTLTLVYEARQPTRLDVSWAFDDGFSAMVIGDYDANNDGKFSPKETEALRGEVFDYLKEHHYFTWITYGGTLHLPDKITDFAVHANQGQVTYSFSIPLDPRPTPGETLRISQYDPTNYSALFLDETTPLTFSGESPPGLTFVIRENTEESYYFGMLHPMEAVVSIDQGGTP